MSNGDQSATEYPAPEEAQGLSEEDRQRNAQIALIAFHQLMVRPERTGGAERAVQWLRQAAIALIPLILVTLVALLAIEPTVGGSSNGTSKRADQERLMTAQQVVADKGVDPEGSPKDAADALSASRTISKLASEAGSKGQVRDHTVYSRQLLFAGVYLVSICLVLFAIAAHSRLIRRHCVTFWQGSEDYWWPKPEIPLKEAARDFLRVPLSPRLGRANLGNFFLYLIIACFLAYLAPIGLPWVMSSFPQSGSFDLSGGEWIGWGLALAIAVLIALVATLAHLTAFGTNILARNYPDISSILKLRFCFEEMPEPKPEKEGPQILLEVQAKGGGDPVEGAVRAFKTLYGSNPNPPPGKAYVDKEMAPGATMTVVRTLIVPLAVVMVLLLVSMSLGLDVLEATQSLPEGLAGAVAATNDAWMFVLGAGFSASLAVIYIGPFIRLKPFVDAEESSKKSPAPSWLVEGGTAVVDGERKLTAKVMQPKTDKPQEFDNAVIHYLGADRAKFTAIMNGAAHGGGFHLLMEETLKKQLAQIAPLLALLAPAFAGGLLKVLG